MQDRLSALGDDASRRATYVCVFAVAWPDGRTRCFRGDTQGTLVWPVRGTLGAGFEPMFECAARACGAQFHWTVVESGPMLGVDTDQHYLAARLPLRWSWRDLRANWVKVVAIALDADLAALRIAERIRDQVGDQHLDGIYLFHIDFPFSFLQHLQVGIYYSHHGPVRTRNGGKPVSDDANYFKCFSIDQRTPCIALLYCTIHLYGIKTV